MSLPSHGRRRHAPHTLRDSVLIISVERVSDTAPRTLCPTSGTFKRLLLRVSRRSDCSSHGDHSCLSLTTCDSTVPLIHDKTIQVHNLSTVKQSFVSIRAPFAHSIIFWTCLVIDWLHSLCKGETWQGDNNRLILHTDALAFTSLSLVWLSFHYP